MHRVSGIGLTVERAERIALEAPVPLFALSVDGLICFWNRACESLLGHAREEVLGRPLSDVLTPGNGVFDTRRGVAETHKRGWWSSRILSQHRSGRPVEVELSMRLVPMGGRGQGELVVGSIRTLAADETR